MHCYILNKEAIDFVVSEDVLQFFPHYKEANDPRGMAKLDPKGMAGRGPQDIAMYLIFKLWALLL